MVSTVKSRPSHYEVLGVDPAASEAEIKAAFTRRMSLFGVHPMAAGAQICAAYETLRDPTRRKAYDRSLGLAPEAEYRPWAMTAPSATPFIGSAAPPARRPIGAMPAVEVDPQALASAEPRTGSVIAASLRDLAAPGAFEPSPAPRAQPEPLLRPEPQPEPGPPVAEDLAPQPIVEDRLADAEEGAVAWKRPAVAVGALVLTVGLFGAWAGWEAGNDVEAAQTEPAVTLAVPPAAAASAETAVALAPAPSVAEARPEPRRATVAEAPANRAMPRPIPLTPKEEQELAGNSFVESATQQVAAAEPATPAAAEAPVTAAVTAAKLPLPNAVVARTIGRIGYSCGQVASMSAVEGGAPGTFKVTCTSGHSYRAAPVRGRYHFRRWGRD